MDNSRATASHHSHFSSEQWVGRTKISKCFWDPNLDLGPRSIYMLVGGGSGKHRKRYRKKEGCETFDLVLYRASG